MSTEEKPLDPLAALQERVPDFPARGASLVDKLTSYLGQHNPFTKPIDPATTFLWLLDNTAYHPSAPGPSSSPSEPGPESPAVGTKVWQAELIGALFVRRTGAESSKLVAQLASVIGLADDGDARKTIASRLVPFLNDILPAHTARVRLGDGEGAETREIGPSGPSGITHDVLEFPEEAYKDGDVLTVRTEEGVEGVPGTTTFAGPKGFAVVSDIDDTIKVTMTNSPLGILKTTFVDDPVPIAGMPAFYAAMAEKLANPPFWYLSASPYNLYPFLRRFRDAHYPAGTLQLRDASWMNLGGFLASLTQGTQAYKVGKLKVTHQYWPQRRLVCIGDSTQSDPEAYGEMYRAQPEWIKAIWIRRVVDVTEAGDLFPWQGQEKRNKDERFEKAFEGVPRDLWHVFDDPSELYERLDSLVSKQAGV